MLLALGNTQHKLNVQVVVECFQSLRYLCPYFENVIAYVHITIFTSNHLINLGLGQVTSILPQENLQSELMTSEEHGRNVIPCGKWKSTESNDQHNLAWLHAANINLALLLCHISSP